ncbi:MAG: OsmC family protein [Chloroflexi bacterium]|nr:OsmC family protein [Chloroflexota bacterium]
MAQVVADYQGRKRIVFTARERSLVNVRVARDDGPVGLTSEELLLVALGNCTLGTLLKHDLLKEVPVRHCRATLESDWADDPRRVVAIRVVIELEVEDAKVRGREDTLRRVAERCPIGNTLRSSPRVDVELRLKAAEPAEA